MPRVTTVLKARKSPGECGKCGVEIKPGAAYRWWKFRYGGKRVRCMVCPGPRASELTNNDKLSQCYAAGEALDDALRAFERDYDLDALRGAAEDAGSEVRAAGEAYRESADNIESGFGHETEQSQEFAQKADNLESKADEIESCISDLEAFDEEGVKIGKGEDEKARIKEARKEWAEGIVSEVEQYTDIDPDM